MPPLVRDLDTNPVTRQIISVDGEGWNIPLSPGIRSANPHAAARGWHSYVMIAAADDNGWHKTLIHDGSRREADRSRARNYGLPTARICDFLLSLPASALLVSFYFSYDATKIFPDLPLENLQELCNEKFIPQEEYERRVMRIAMEYGLSPDYIHRAKLVSIASTVYAGYWISYTPRKRLDIIDLKAGRAKISNRDTATGRIYPPENRWVRKITVWDAYGFFQKSFVKALTDYRCGQCPGCKASPQEHCERALWSAADLERIESMKAQRGVFDASRLREIETYCVDECRYLSFLMRDLITHVDEFGLRLTGYHGSGAIASAWMKQNKIKDYLPRREETDSPGVFNLSGLPEEIALCAYFGGRFEISEMGFMGALYGYDINSAYPHITCSLPCLAHGRFRRVDDYQPGKIGVYLCGSRTSGRYAPFPFRTPGSGQPAGTAKDAIYYCHGGQRWIWQDELAAARKHFGTEAIPVYDGYVWEPECDHKPFAAIPDLYRLRQQYVREGNGVEKVIKLILNSLYGKTAQSLGWSLQDGQAMPPPFQCFIWAGLITSGCRPMILDAVMQPDADVVSIATDGILSRSRIASLPCPAEKILGAWEAGDLTDGYLFQSGVYTYITAKGKRKYATRGFAAKEIPAQALIDAWKAGETTVSASRDESRFIPMKSGVLRSDALEYIGQWVPSEHDVSFTHNRRLPVYSVDEYGEIDLSGLIPLSEPHIVPDDALSAPYEPKQTWEDVLENQPLPDQVDYMEYAGLLGALADTGEAGPGLAESLSGLAGEPDTGPGWDESPAGPAEPDF